MSDSRIFRIARVATGLIEHLNHQPATFNRYDWIFLSVKRPNGNTFDLVSEAHISPTTNRDSGCEMLRVSYQRFPSRKAAHGNPGDVDTILIHRILALNHKQELERSLQRSCGLRRQFQLVHLFPFTGPHYRLTAEMQWALRDQHKTRMFGL